MDVAKFWQEKYFETHQHYDEGILKELRDSVPKKLSLVSSQNKIIFKQLLDINLSFIEYLKCVESFSIALLSLIVELKSELNDPEFDYLINEAMPLIKSASNLMHQKSKEAHYCINEFSSNVFTYIEKE